MTDRIHSITVVLDHDMREDDVQNVIAAIGMIRGVLSVTPHVSDLTSHMAEQRARAELGEKIWTVLYPKHTQG